MGKAFAFLPVLSVAAIVVGAVIFTSPWSTTPSVASDPALGDVDCNQEIEAGDALFVLRFVVAIEPFGDCIEDAGDTTCDDDIEAVDALRILKFLAGFLDTLGVCPETLSYFGRELVPAELGLTTHFAPLPGSATHGVIGSQIEAILYKVELEGDGEPVVFGDLSGLVNSNTLFEGLLHFAFSPTFEEDGFLYVYYTRGTPAPAVLSRFDVENDLVDLDSEQVLVEVPSPIGALYGGSIDFDSNGYLYLSVGSGGVEAEPQNIESIFGSVIRLDVSQLPPTPPEDNPFVGTDGLDEVLAYGFRNPWRMSIDRANDEVWLGDVGQTQVEEVNKVEPGKNYGWDVFEGTQCLGFPCNLEFEPPYFSYLHPPFQDETSITGGHVYRGDALPELNGWYLYSDFFTGDIFAVNTDYSHEPVLLLESERNIVSFTVLENGESAFVGFDGSVHMLEADADGP